MNVSLNGEIKLTKRERETLEQAGKLAQTIAVHRPGTRAKENADLIEIGTRYLLGKADSLPTTQEAKQETPPA